MGNKTGLQGTLGIALDIHVYLFGALFLVTTLASIGIGSYMVITRKKVKYTAFAYYLLLVICIGLLGLSRTLFLFIDPYGIHMYSDPLLREVNLNLANAFLASAIFMLLIVLVRLTRMQSISKKFLGAYFLVGIIIVNVTVSVSADVVVGLYKGLEVLMICCASYFIMWGVCCCAIFIYIICHFYKLIYINRKRLYQQSTMDAHPGATTNHTETKMPMAMKLSIIIFVIFVLHIATLVYALVAMTVLKDEAEFHGAWSWWARNTAKRTIELAFAVTILGVAVSVVRTAHIQAHLKVSKTTSC